MKNIIITVTLSFPRQRKQFFDCPPPCWNSHLPRYYDFQNILDIRFIFAGISVTDTRSYSVTVMHTIGRNSRSYMPPVGDPLHISLQILFLLLLSSVYYFCFYCFCVLFLFLLFLCIVFVFIHLLPLPNVSLSVPWISGFIAFTTISTRSTTQMDGKIG